MIKTEHYKSKRAITFIITQSIFVISITLENMRIILFTITFVLSVISCSNVGPKIKKDEVASVANKVADWQIEHLTYRDSGNLHDYGIDAWTNSVFYLGLAQWASKSDKSDQYFAWLYDSIGNKNNWSIPANFLHYQPISYYHADELCVAQSYIELYNKYGERRMVDSVITRLNMIMKNPGNQSLSYRNKQSWSWCDALFMAPPVYLGIAKVEENESYIDFMHDNFLATYYHLYDDKEKLFYRDDSYFDKTENNGQKIFWGRGNGWVVAGLANIIKLMPKDDSRRLFYKNLFADITTRLVQLQHEDGFWHASLLDPDSYPSPETSATALITYAIAYGINEGILDKSDFYEPMYKSWTSLLSAIDDDGKLGWVQPIGADPKKVTRDMTSVYGPGAFLMAATEIYKMK